MRKLILLTFVLNSLLPAQGLVVRRRAVASGSTQIANDTFTGTAGTTIQAHNSCWVINGGGGFNIQPSGMHPTGAGQNLAHWNSTCNGVNANQYSQVTITALAASTYNGAAVLVASGTTETGYRCVFTTNAIQLEKAVSGTYSGLGSAVSRTMAANDVVRLEATVTTSTALVCKVNGTAVITQTDSSSPILTGQPGIAGYSSGSTFVTPWSAGNL